MFDMIAKKQKKKDLQKKSTAGFTLAFFCQEHNTLVLYICD